MHSHTKKIVIASLMAALACVATMIVKIPSPMSGYINLGDCIVLVSAFLLSAGYGFAAAGIGSALADLLSGYVAYAPATLVIKGTMALIAFGGYRLLQKKLGSVPARILTGLVAELVMVVGYFLFEGVLYGYGLAVLNIPGNSAQGAAGLILGCMLAQVFEKNKITFE